MHQDRHPVGQVHQQPPVWEQARGAHPTRPVEPVEAGDLVGDVVLDVPDPEAEAAVGRDLNAPDGVVPELRDGEEVADGDADDGAVGADGDGVQEDHDEERLEEEEAQLER